MRLSYSTIIKMQTFFKDKDEAIEVVRKINRKKRKGKNDFFVIITYRKGFKIVPREDYLLRNKIKRVK